MKGLEGKLEKISGVFTIVNAHFASFGKGKDDITRVVTELVISETSGVKQKIEFVGIVLPDSIGHNVIYSTCDNDGNYPMRQQQLIDLELGREYKAIYWSSQAMFLPLSSRDEEWGVYWNPKR